MGIIIAISRYLLPALTLIILIKCMMPLILGHPKEKVYGYIIDLSSGESHPLGMWETSIGRSNSCDIVIGYDTVSRFQAVISRRVDGWYIYDLLSKSGILVNGEKIEKKQTVKSGDVLTFGIMQYRFVVSDDPIIKVGKKKNKKKQTERAAQPPQPINQSPVQHSDFDGRYIFEKDNQGCEVPLFDDDETFNLKFRERPSQNSYRGSIYSSKDSVVIETPQAREEQAFYSYDRARPSVINPETGEIFALFGNHISIGRNRTNDIVLSSPSVSRHHADIVLYEDGWAIVDSNSAAGTCLNSVRINEPQLLFDGDVIGISDERLRFTTRPNFKKY